MPLAEKQCAKCGHVRPVEMFYERRREGVTVPTTYCRPCTRAVGRAYRAGVKPPPSVVTRSGRVPGRPPVVVVARPLPKRTAALRLENLEDKVEELAERLVRLERLLKASLSNG